MAREPLKVLTESMFYVLLSLLRQKRCGTEIVQFVDDTTAGRVMCWNIVLTAPLPPPMSAPRPAVSLSWEK